MQSEEATQASSSSSAHQPTNAVIDHTTTHDLDKEHTSNYDHSVTNSPPRTPPRESPSSPLPSSSPPPNAAATPSPLKQSPSSRDLSNLDNSPTASTSSSPSTPDSASKRAGQGSSSPRATSPGSPTTPTTRRVKLYVLKNDNWDDLGTGYCTSHFVDTPIGNTAASPEEGAWIVVQRESSTEHSSNGASRASGSGSPPSPTSSDGPESGEIILRTKVQPYPSGYLSDDDDEEDDLADDVTKGVSPEAAEEKQARKKAEDPNGYQRQQDTLIVWTDKATEMEMALSFATAQGCSEIWEFIRRARRWTTEQLNASMSPSPAPSSPQHVPLYAGNATRLPEPAIGNIEQVETAIRALSRSVVGRERTAATIFKTRYIEKLIKVHQDAEDLESLSDLHALCRVMQAIFLLNDSAIFDLVLRDELILGVASILEYDPEFPTMKASYRVHLSDSSNFRAVVPIRSSSLVSKIHQTHRLYYLKDVVLARVLEDSTFSMLNSAIYFNEVEIVNDVASDPTLLKEIFAIFDDPKPANTATIGPQLPSSIIGPQMPSTVASTSTGSPPATSPDKQHDAILFLQQFTSMAKNLQLPARVNLFRSLADRGLLRVIEVALSRAVSQSDAGMRGATIEIFMALVNHDPGNVRAYTLKQQSVGKRPLVMFLIELLHKEEDLGLKSQMAEALKVLLDAGTEPTPPEGPPRLRQEDPDAEKFLQYFYDHSMNQLLAPIIQLPKLEATDPPLDLSLPQIALCGHLCDLLCFFISHHTFRSKYFVLSSSISTHVTKLFRARQKHLRLAALRYLRSCLGRNDDFYNRFLIKNDLFAPVIETSEAENKRDNLLASACLEFYEYIRNNNIKAIINHLVERFGDRIRALAVDSNTLSSLLSRWEQNNEPPPTKTEGSNSGPSSKPMTREASFARMDVEEESYFNGSDDEDSDAKSTGSVSPVIRKREADATNGNRKRAKISPSEPSPGGRKMTRVEQIWFADPSKSSSTDQAGQSQAKGLVDYGDDEDDLEDSQPGGFIRESDSGKGDLESATANGAQIDPGPDQPTETSPPEFKLKELKRKADDDEEDGMSLLSARKNVKTAGKGASPAAKAMVKGGAGTPVKKTGSAIGGGLKISLGVKNLVKLAGGKKESGPDKS